VPGTGVEGVNHEDLEYRAVFDGKVAVTGEDPVKDRDAARTGTDHGNAESLAFVHASRVSAGMR